MEKNEIANINNMSDEQIMQAIGQDDGSSKGINIPRLGINRSPEDDDGNLNITTWSGTIEFDLVNNTILCDLELEIEDNQYVLDLLFEKQ